MMIPIQLFVLLGSANTDAEGRKESRGEEKRKR